MIKINLATKKQAAFAAEGGTSALGGLRGTRIDMDLIKELPVIRVLLSLVVAFLLYSGSAYQKEQVINGLEQERIAAQAEITELTKKVAATNGYENLKKNLEENEIRLRTKIETITTLVKDRTKSPKMLLIMSQIIPREVWLENFSIKGDDISIKGGATDFNMVSDFMKRLDESIYFDNPTLIDSDTQKGQATFSLKTGRK